MKIFILLIIIITSCKSIDTETAHGQYQMGEQLYNQNKYHEAYKWYELSANNGDSNALYEMGLIYLDDKIYKHDYQKSLNYFHDSAKKNNTNSMYQLGVLYGFGYGVERNKKVSKEWFLKAASLGHIESKEMIRNLNNH